MLIDVFIVYLFNIIIHLVLLLTIGHAMIDGIYIYHVNSFVTIYNLHKIFKRKT